MFQSWYRAHLSSGNRLHKAKVLWIFYPKPNFLLSFAMKVEMWVEAERRVKSNEYIFGRRDIASVLPIWTPDSGGLFLETRVVLVREFRSNSRNSSSFVYELPGGGAENEMGEAVSKVAAMELEQETGIKVAVERLKPVSSRQLHGPTSCHQSHLFLLRLTDDEFCQAEKTSTKLRCFGDPDETELTYVEIKTVRELLLAKDADFATLGMVLDGLFSDLGASMESLKR